jgi:hypothetical protein
MFGRRADNIVKSMLEHSRGVSGERRAVDTRQGIGADDRRPRSINLGDDAARLCRARLRWFLGVAQERLYRRLDDANDFEKNTNGRRK